MGVYLMEVSKLERAHVGFDYQHIPWLENQWADEITRLASLRSLGNFEIFVEKLLELSISQASDVDEELVYERPIRHRDWPSGLDISRVFARTSFMAVGLPTYNMLMTRF